MAATREPATDDRTFWRGEIVFDRKRTDILSDPLCVVDPEIRQLGSYKSDAEKYRAIKHNDTNTSLANLSIPSDGLPDRTPCIDVAFLDGENNEPTVESRTYTYPTFRLMRVVGDEESDLPQFRPPMMAAAQLLHQLEASVASGGIESVDDLHVAIMEAGIDGEVLAAAKQLSDSKW